MNLVILGVILFISLPLWMVTAGDRRTRWGFAIVLAVSCVVDVLLALKVILPDVRLTLTVLLVFAVAATLYAGIVVDNRATGGAPRLGRGRGRGRAQGRGKPGRVTTQVYSSVLVLLGIVALIYLGVNGAPAQVPETSVVLPLPPGVSIDSTVSNDCGDGSQSCTREIQLNDGGRPDGDVMQAVARQLSTNGWKMTGDATDGWSGCRSTGILLDRGSMCAGVGDPSGNVTIELEFVSSH